MGSLQNRGTVCYCASDNATFAKQKKALRAVDNLDLDMVKQKLCLPPDQEGKGWTSQEADECEVHYKRFLKLHIITGGTDIVPTKMIDQMWHAHILDTNAYHADCQKVFGGYLHHFPYFGLRGKKDAQNLQKAFEKSCALFREHFGKNPIGAIANAKASCAGGGTGGGSGCSRNSGV